MAATATPTRGRVATCNAILGATSELIAERGVDGFALTEVARRAGVNRALIYHYFQDRENLVTKAIDHVISRYDTEDPELPEYLERSMRMYIKHPEIGRLFFQLILNKRPLLHLGDRITKAVDGVRRAQQEYAPGPYDPAFAVIILVLVQLSWSFARHELARLLNMSVEEADERFSAELKRASEAGARDLLRQP